MSVSANNAHQVLELKLGATPEELRKAYLALVRRHPPDRDPEKFRDIHAAYQLLNDPLAQATALLTLSRDKPDLMAVIEEAEKVRPRLATPNLLALGNEAK